MSESTEYMTHELPPPPQKKTVKDEVKQAC